MLSIAKHTSAKFCDGVSRRHVLRIGALGFGGLTLADMLRSDARAGTRSKRRSIINIILSGGLSNSGSTQTSGMAVIRRITVTDPSTDISSVSISVGSNSTGGSLVANAAALSSLTAINTYQNLTLSNSANTTCLNGNVSSALFVNQTAGTVSGATYDIYIYGDVFKP